MRVLAVLALALVTSGCGYSIPRLSFAVEQRILRETTLDDLPEGQADARDGIVRIVRMAKDSQGQCSGALIGPRQVLTATHCVVRLDAKREMTEASLVAGDLHVELGGGYLPWGRVGVRAVHECGGYSPNERSEGGERGKRDDAEHDVAVLVLSKPVPRDVPIFEIGWDVPAEAAVFELGGFGSGGKLKAMPESGFMMIQSDRHVHRGPVRSVTPDLLAVSVPGVPGDSGGPIIDVATGRVVSVASRGRAKTDDKEDENKDGIVLGPRLMQCRGAIELAFRPQPTDNAR